MKVAALDLGSNSFLCLVAEVNGGRIDQIISDQVEIVRLGQGVSQTRAFHPEALARAKSCLSRFSEVIQQHRPERILAMATSAARDVVNKEELFQIGHELGIPIEVIPGEKEAHISYLGATSALDDSRSLAVLDIGGGSTEIIVGQKQSVLFGQSLDVGAVRQTEMFFTQQPPSEEDVRRLQKYVQTHMEGLFQQLRRWAPNEMIAVAGTPTELAAASLGGYDPQKIDQFLFTVSSLEDWTLKLQKTTPSERTSRFGISAGRADIILAGAVILKEALKLSGLPHLKVSTRGLRFGVAIEAAHRSS